MTYIFDMGGVLVDIDVYGFMDRLKKLMPSGSELGASPNELLGGGGQSFFHDYEMGYISTEEALLHFHSICRQDITDQQIKEVWFSELAPVSEKVKAILRHLRRDSNNTVFMLSNTNPMHWEEYIAPMFNADGYTLDDYFNRVFLSYQLHLFKPEREMYAEIEKYIPRGDSVVYVDDVEKNRLAAPDRWQTFASINEMIHPMKMNYNISK